MTGLWLGIFLKRARKLIRFSATGVVEKVGSTMRKRSWRDTLCSGVDMTEGSKEGGKERGRKEGRTGRRQRTGGYCESRAPVREVSKVARISRLYRRRDGPDASGQKEEEEKKHRRRAVKSQGRTTYPFPPRRLETQKGKRNKPWKRDETLPGNAINRPDGRRRDFRSARRAGEARSDGALNGENLICALGLQWGSRRSTMHERRTRAFESIVRKGKERKGKEGREIADGSLEGELAVGLLRIYYFQAWNAESKMLVWCLNYIQ